MTVFKPLNMASVQALVGKSEEAMIYGRCDCGWNWLPEELAGKSSPIKRVYDDEIAILENGPTKTLDDREITQIAPWTENRAEEEEDEDLSTKRTCKTALVDWAIEVWKRKGSEKQIPLIFTIDRTGNPYPPSAENYLSKTKKSNGIQLNKLITHAEIRRLYKLCTDETIDSEVRKAVRENIRFVSLETRGEETFLKAIKAPWEDPQWKVELDKRKEYRRTKESGRRKKEYDWRKELNDAVKAERALQAAKKDPVDFKEQPKTAPAAPQPAEDGMLKALLAAYRDGGTPKNV